MRAVRELFCKTAHFSLLLWTDMLYTEAEIIILHSNWKCHSHKQIFSEGALCLLCTNYVLAFTFLQRISGCENTKGALDVACYPFQGALSEPHTAAVVTFMRLRLPTGSAHTHTHMQQNSKDIHSTVCTHWVMMGLSIPIKACSSRLDSQSIEMDSDQRVLGLWFSFLQGHHVYSCRGKCLQPYGAVN